MRIEILVDNEEPKIYPLDRPKIAVGSHEACDIVINHKSISRKHLIIVAKDEKIFVADQGSMNGSFINEHRLIPGSSTEFTSFFPVRLGDNVLVTLLSDEEALELGPDSEYNSLSASGTPVGDESTKMISLKDLHKSSTSELVKKRNETVTKRKVTAKKAIPVKKQTLSTNTLISASVVLISAAAYLQYAWNAYSEPKESLATKVEEAPPVPVVDNRPIKRVDLEGLASAETILGALDKPKCSTEVEQYLCTTLPMINQGKGGTVLIDKTIVIFPNGAQYATNAKTYLKNPLSIEEGGTKAALDAYNMELSLMSLMLWMNENIPLGAALELDKIKDYTLAVALVDSSKEHPGLMNTAFFVPDSFIRLREKIQEKHFADAKKNGALEFFFAYEYLRFP